MSQLVVNANSVNYIHVTWQHNIAASATYYASSMN